MALELKYHCSGLTALYNRELPHIAEKNKETLESSQEMDFIPLLFSELLAYVIEKRYSTDEPAIFRLAELVLVCTRSNLRQTYLI